MRTKIGLLTIVILIAVLGLALYQATAQSSGASCTIRSFEATVRQGPSQGTVYDGRLTLQSDADGALSGTLTSTDGTTVVVVGQVDGHAINLAFDLGASGVAEQYLFGVGTMASSFPDCSGAMGGPFVGPQDRDSGDWSVHGGPPVGG